MEKKIDEWWLKPFNKDEYVAYHKPKKLEKIERLQQKKMMKEKRDEDFWVDCREEPIKAIKEEDYILELDMPDFFDDDFNEKNNEDE